MTIGEICSYLETIAPLSYQESYDNCGLITGNRQTIATAALITLDCIESVVDEAINKQCNLIIAHHPIVFSGLKKINGANYVERVIIKAIQNNIAIYAIHTNLDNVSNGVNAEICNRLGLKNCQILLPKENLLKKLVTFIPVADFENVSQAVFDAGAGHIGNYSETGFSHSGTGTFKGNEHTNPAIGEKGKLEKVQELRFETIFPSYLQNQIVKTLQAAHPYQEVAYDIYSLSNHHTTVGSGMIGEQEIETDESEFLLFIKKKLKAACIRHTALRSKKIKKVAVCGGSGSFLLRAAIASNADCYITADFKYHEFFDAEGKIIIADVGHYESEQYTKDLLHSLLSEKFPTFALHLSHINTNPINYI
jgi:dinuclear metal center YbgI/SA1388 family protein